MLWSREEALANVVAVEFIELPVSDLDAAIESEFDQKEGRLNFLIPYLKYIFSLLAAKRIKAFKKIKY